MVAKSFQNLEIITEPHNINGKPYVIVKFPNNTTKQVRWYSEREYFKMYPETVKMTKSLKEILGFANGYITIFKGNTYFEREYFRSNSARYHKLWGWYFVSTEDLPQDIPEDVEPIHLNWETIGLDDNNLRPESEITKAVNKLVYDESPSKYQGAIGDKLDRIVTISKVIPLQGSFGLSHMHIMYDNDENCYIWTTAAKTLNLNETYHIVGTVKDHSEYKNTKQTILTRCRILT